MAADDEEEGERGKGLTDVDQIGVDEEGAERRNELRCPRSTMKKRGRFSFCSNI